MYGQMRLPVVPQQPPFLVPSSALVFDAAGTRVWTVDAQDTAQSKLVEVGRDFGTEIEIASGLADDDRIVTNPGSALVHGSRVTLAPGSRAANPASATAR